MDRRFSQLLRWVRERPDSYCRTVGELEVLIRQLYEVCASSAARHRQFTELLAQRLEECGLASTLQVLDAADRNAPARRGDPATERLIAFWAPFDAALGLPAPRDDGRQDAGRATD